MHHLKGCQANHKVFHAVHVVQVHAVSNVSYSICKFELPDRLVRSCLFRCFDDEFPAILTNSNAKDICNKIHNLNSDESVGEADAKLMINCVIFV